MIKSRSISGNGKNIIVTGTLVETSNKLKEEMSQLIKLIHSG